MRIASTRKSIAVAYVLGLILTVALVGGALVLSQPMLTLYETIGVESVVVQFVATTALVILMAVSVTIAVGLILRGTADTAEASNRS